ncbi:MAG TPA: hypothetical protein PKC20_13605, partial [Burkholderiaceae bacterium]|nr:hypothetical protein [Burkholderiaceae bacterium]
MLRLTASRRPGSDRTVCLCANTSWYLANFRSRLIDALIADGWRVTAWAPPDAYVDRLVARGARPLPMRLDNASTHPLHELATRFRARLELRRRRKVDVEHRARLRARAPAREPLHQDVEIDVHEHGAVELHAD